MKVHAAPVGFAAKLAGEKALRELLDGLAQEGDVRLSQKLRAAPIAGCLMVAQTLPIKPAGLHKLLHCVEAAGEGTLKACWIQPFPSRLYSLRRSSASLFSSP